MKSKIWILAAIIPVVFFADQFTKRLVVRDIPIGSSIAVLPGIFDLVHTRNKGAAFGFMANLPEHLRLPFFFVVSFVALSLITIYFLRLNDPRKGITVCLALILGGAFGNIWDRITLGEVVDFLSLHWYDKIVEWNFSGAWLRFRLEWPAFNVADSAISVAVVCLMILMMKDGKKNQPVP